MDAKTFRETAHAAIEDIIVHVTSFTNRRVTPTISPGYLKPLLPSRAPAKPESPKDILNDIDQKIKPGLTDWQHPNYFAFFPANLSFPSLLGELYSAAFNAPAFNWLCSPACTELETIMMDWVARMLGLPSCFLSDGPTAGGGVIQGSASEAVLVAMVASRERYIRNVLTREGLLPESPDDPEELILRREDRAADVRGRLVALGSEQAHSSTHKGANVLGLRYRTVPAPAPHYAVTGDALRKRIRELRAQGLEPVYITICLATTSTCAIDDFGAIADVAREEAPDMWIHVDAAYAGGALICPEFRSPSFMDHLERLDSFDVNMHKWLNVNFDASCMFVRSRLDLTQGLTITPAYLQNPEAIKGLVTDYRDWQIPLGRRFRALKVWWVLRSYGVEGLQKMVREHVRLGHVFAELCQSQRGQGAGLEVVAGPAYALTVIRVRADAFRQKKQMTNGTNGTNKTSGTIGVNGHANGVVKNPADEMNDFGNKAAVEFHEPSNALTKEVYERINKDGEFFLTSTVLQGTYVIRVVGANPNTSEKVVRRLFDVIVETIEQVRKQNGIA
ncbi:MAG: hypothetical protein Q9162_006159 [Coniocarpon cinnabarinum]